MNSEQRTRARSLPRETIVMQLVRVLSMALERDGQLPRTSCEINHRNQGAGETSQPNQEQMKPMQSINRKLIHVQAEIQMDSYLVEHLNGGEAGQRLEVVTWERQSWEGEGALAVNVAFYLPCSVIKEQA